MRRPDESQDTAFREGHEGSLTNGAYGEECPPSAGCCLVRVNLSRGRDQDRDKAEYYSDPYHWKDEFQDESDDYVYRDEEEEEPLEYDSANDAADDSSTSDSGECEESEDYKRWLKDFGKDPSKQGNTESEFLPLWIPLDKGDGSLGKQEVYKGKPVKQAVSIGQKHRFEHVAGLGCVHHGGYSGYAISYEEMKGCHIVQCLVPKSHGWVKEVDDQDFEVHGDYFLSGLSDMMPSRDVDCPRVFPARHGVDMPETDNSDYAVSCLDVGRLDCNMLIHKSTGAPKTLQCPFIPPALKSTNVLRFSAMVTSISVALLASTKRT